MFQIYKLKMGHEKNNKNPVMDAKYQYIGKTLQDEKKIIDNSNLYTTTICCTL